MSNWDYERLTALDSTFLDVESRTSHMHVGAVTLFDAGPLTGIDGCIDVVRIRRVIEAGFRRFPRYRQRLAWIPVFDHPVWIDDEHFKIDYHVRHTSLPKPGDERLLKRFAGRLMSQQLDRGKPLWEIWIVEGVEDDQVAIVSKLHHCMIDGVGSVALTGAMMSNDAREGRDAEVPTVPWVPRPAPTPRELFLDECKRLGMEPFALLKGLGSAALNPGKTWRTVGNAVGGIQDAISAGLKPASDTPLNRNIGPHRRFDWTEIELKTIKHIRNELGGTLNDVVLTSVSGAVGNFLRQRGIRVEDLDFRAMVPVNTRESADREALGNRIAMLLARLPIAERDPVARLRSVQETTKQLKSSKQAQGVSALEDLSDVTLMGLFSAFAKLSANARSYNMVVTNVPGPREPVYLLGSKMRSVYPLVPLNRNQALGIAVFSYCDRLFWGFNSDWDSVPDLHEVVTGIDHEFDKLVKIADSPPPRVNTGEKPAATA